MKPSAARARRALAGRASLTAAAVLLAAAALSGAVSAGVPTRAEPETRILTTTGPVPPATVKPATGPHRAVAVAAGEVVVSGVPAYIWRDGCAPTSTGIVLGYWDGHGFPDLIPGDASTATPAVNQAIASHGTAGAPGHYEDYALPNESASAPPKGQIDVAGQERGPGRRRARKRLRRRLHAHVLERRGPALRLELHQHGRPGVRRLRRAAPDRLSPLRTPTTTSGATAPGRSRSTCSSRRSTRGGRWSSTSTATATGSATTPSPASATARSAATPSTPAGTPGARRCAGRASAASPPATAGASQVRRRWR